MVNRFTQNMHEIQQRNLHIIRACLEEGNNDRAEDRKAMCALKSVPYRIIVLSGHPTRSHKQVENQVHDEQQDDEIEYLTR